MNPRITDHASETDEQFEGCLSFFDVRGMVPRPLRITVEATNLDGQPVTTTYERGLARLIHHEIDHLDGLLYTARNANRRQPHPCRGVPTDWAGVGLQPMTICARHPGWSPGGRGNTAASATALAPDLQQDRSRLRASTPIAAHGLTPSN
ncbi:peptide deformylase [Kitasatospora sp. NPDC005748]|uniref:peptide deformylase n=1 Tax=Kitasatospora sp. NPDC005748 TaxID=3157063 RepID=UPI0033D864F6